MSKQKRRPESAFCPRVQCLLLRYPQVHRYLFCFVVSNVTLNSTTNPAVLFYLEYPLGKKSKIFPSYNRFWES